MNEPQREAEVARLLPIVYRIARRVARLCRLREVDDLIGDGSVGLVRAVDNYDPRRGVSLDCYARHVVLGAMLNRLRRTDPVSERARRTVRRPERLRTELELRGTPPSERDLEQAVPGLRRARSQVEWGLPLSLDITLPKGTHLTPDWREDPARVYDAQVRRQMVVTAVAGLPRRLRAIVAAYYFGGVPLRALSEHLAVTPQRVSQLHCRALGQLRDRIKEAV